jgi:hypothetical protein
MKIIPHGAAQPHFAHHCVRGYEGLIVDISPL